MSGAREVIVWSRQRPVWQQDLLRRVVDGRVADTDVVEVARLCRRDAGLPVIDTESPASAAPLSGNEPAVPLESRAAVAITSLRLDGVNALLPSTLTFAPSGMTVVYGDNGAGKSGFARVLKVLCSGRGDKPAVLPNVFAETPAAPTAEVSYALGSEPRSFGWDASNSSTDLRGATVFDSSSCSGYVGERNDLAYRPLALAWMEELARGCERVARVLGAEVEQLKNSQPTFPKVDPTTPAGGFLRDLSARATMEQLDATINAAALDSELSALRGRLDLARADDARRRELAVRRDRLAKLADDLRRIGIELVTEKLDALRSSVDTAADLRRSAEAVAAQAFSTSPLPGVGGAAWRALWDAARRFAAVADPHRNFPCVDPGSRCMLCQQTLDVDAQARFGAFARAVSADLEVAAAAAETQVALKHESLAQLRGDLAVLRGSLPDVEIDDAALAGQLSQWIAAAERVIDGVTHNRRDAVEAPPLDALHQLIAALSVAPAPSELVDLERAWRELEARDRLRDWRDSVLLEIERLRTVELLEKAIAGCHTKAISRKAGELARALITEGLTESFAKELIELKVTHAGVVLEPSGTTRGAFTHSIRLRSRQNVDADAVLSEGEYRCVALAAFFAEISVAPVASAIVLDDPVSSLDHERRSLIARRLAREANKRQVIVLTHDLTFVMMLHEAAVAQGAQIATREIRRKGTAPGSCSETTPWPAMKTAARIGALRSEWQRIEKLFRTADRAEYDNATCRLYGLLREAWERAVEEHVLLDSVQRFRRSIETTRLKDGVYLSKAEYKALHDGMSKASAIFIGHDNSSELNEPTPEPGDVQKDISELEEWVKRVQAQRPQRT